MVWKRVTPWAMILVSALAFAASGCGSSMKDGTDSGGETESAAPENTDAGDGEAAENDMPGLEVSGIPVPEQTFEVELDGWGTVTFASFAPENHSFAADGRNPDVRFYLMRDGAALYEFPGWNEEHGISDLFLSVSAVAFRDYNDDGLQDVITLCEYETMSGEGYQLPRIYFQLEEQQGFEEHALLTEYLMKNSYTDSIETIMSVKEEYWDYLDSLNGHRSVDEQLRVIAENRSQWCPDLEYAGELCQYAVADLDRNGRYEVIVSDMAGTGLYTYSRFFEINDSYDGLTECGMNVQEGDSQPDLMDSTWEMFTNEQGEFLYVVYDLIRNSSAEYYENVRSLILQDGEVLMSSPIACRTTIYSYDSPDMSVSCKDADGNAISEEEYESAADNYFSGWQKSEIHLGWQDVSGLADDTEGAAAQLEQSLNVYSSQLGESG